jgi:hypothetical protein
MYAILPYYYVVKCTDTAPHVAKVFSLILITSVSTRPK